MFFLGIVVCSVLAAAVATDVQQCSGQSFDLKNHIQLSPCKKSPCRLKKGSNQHITIIFTPESEMNEVRNHITATIAGLVLPFPGVDGANICDKIENEAGEKVSCPLQAGTKYIYKDSFPILSIYPSIELKVHWALKHKKQNIICFEVPAKIV